MAHTLRSFFVLLLAAALILLEGGAAAAPEALARVPSGSCAKIDKRQEWSGLLKSRRLPENANAPKGTPFRELTGLATSVLSSA